MICELCAIYGWKKEYLLENLTLRQLSLYYKYGRRYDMYKHGFTFKEEQEDFDDLRKIYYTEEERKAQEQALNRLKDKYGDVESEVRGK